MAIAPHESLEVRLVLAGTKPMAVIEHKKDPYGFALAVSFAKTGALYYRISEGEVVLTKPNNKFLVDFYHNLTKYGVKDYGIKEYHRQMGKLFGYSKKDIEDFIDAEIKCNCTKCIGG
jgi:hypothetical protein